MEAGGTRSFNALPRIADLFRSDRESIPEKVQKPGRNILVYTFVFLTKIDAFIYSIKVRGVKQNCLKGKAGAR